MSNDSSTTLKLPKAGRHFRVKSPSLSQRVEAAKKTRIVRVRIRRGETRPDTHKSD